VIKLDTDRFKQAESMMDDQHGCVISFWLQLVSIVVLFSSAINWESHTREKPK